MHVTSAIVTVMRDGQPTPWANGFRRVCKQFLTSAPRCRPDKSAEQGAETLLSLRKRSARDGLRTGDVSMAVQAAMGRHFGDLAASRKRDPVWGRPPLKRESFANTA
jgi:hypothetical protein